MRRIRILAPGGLASCVLALAFATPAAAAAIVWTLEVSFEDGGTAQGFIDFDFDAQALNGWSISVSGGDTETYPPVTYSPATGTGSVASFGTKPEDGFLFAIGSRQLRVTPKVVLDGAVGVVAVEEGEGLDTSGAEECFNCSPFREITGGFFRRPLGAGSSTDPFDSTQGTVVTADDTIVDPINAFRTSGGFEDGNTLMGDVGLGNTSFIEFRTAKPVAIVGIRLLAHNDSSLCCLRRTMSGFALFADVDGDNEFETTVLNVPINPDYGQQPGNAALNPSDLDLTLFSEGALQAQRWRLEVTQGSDFENFEGARLIEVDAIPAPPEDCTNGMDDDGDGLPDVDDPDCDVDRDEVFDGFDNCPPDPEFPKLNTFNPLQEDRDRDGVGDPCDPCPSDPDAEPDGGLCPKDLLAKSGLVTSSAPTFNPGEPVPVECAFQVTGAPLTIIRPEPDCRNTTIQCEDSQGRILSPVFDLPQAVGIPDDVVTFFPGETFTVFCDLSQRFPKTELAAGSEGEPETYSCTCTYSSYHRDPDLDANGNCAVPPEEGGCVDLDVIQSTTGDFDITVEGDPVQGASIDLKPGECPNSWNTKSKGILKVAVIGGGEDLNVAQIDPATVRLSRADGLGGSVAPNDGPPGPKGAVLKDVATPFVGAVEDCHELEGDGIVDLSLAFRTEEAASALQMSAFQNGALVQLQVSGALFDGTLFEASGDAVRLVPPGTPPGALKVTANLAAVWVDVSPKDEQLDGGGFAPFTRTFPQTSVVTLTAPISPAGHWFAGWSVNGGELVPGNQLPLTILNDEHVVNAVYRSGGSCGLGGELVLLLLPFYWLRHRRARRAGLASLLLTAALLVAGSPAGAQQADTDRDGFPNALEAAGIPLFDGTTIPTCSADGSTPRWTCVDPSSPDLFVIIVRSDPGCDPLADARCIAPVPDATSLIARSLAEGGLGIAVHEIQPSQAVDRTVSPAAAQKAVQMTEDRNPAADKLGNCPGHGTPNDDATCKIFTQKIFDFVTEVCAGASQCDASTGEVGRDAVVRRYVKHTLNHEIAHNFLLTELWTARFGGYHEKAGSGVIMEQSSKYTNKGGKVTWYISTEFGIPDQEAATLVAEP